MGLFDKLLEQMKDEDKAVLEKYPQLKEAVTNLEAAYFDADQRLLGWERWKIPNWDEQAGTTKETVELREQVKRLEAAGVSDMTFDEIKEQLRKEGFVATKADIDAALASQKFISAEDHQKALNNLAAGFEQMYAKSAILPLKHKDEFGENLDMAGLFKYMNENKVYDPEEAHSKMVAGRRAEMTTAAQTALEEKHKQEIAEAEARGAKTKAEELAMSASGSPTDLGGPAPLMGHLDRLRMSEKGSADLPETVKSARLGDMQTAQAAFEDYRKSKVSGTVQ